MLQHVCLPLTSYLIFRILNTLFSLTKECNAMISQLKKLLACIFEVEDLQDQRRYTAHSHTDTTRTLEFKNLYTLLINHFSSCQLVVFFFFKQISNVCSLVWFSLSAGKFGNKNCIKSLRMFHNFRLRNFTSRN